MSDMPEVAMNKSEKTPPTSRVSLSKDEASKMKVGSHVCLSLEGEVKSLHPSYDDKEMYEVEIENPSVEVEQNDDESSEDDENPAKMPLGKLKKKIMPQDEE